MKLNSTNRWSTGTVGISKPRIYYSQGTWHVLYQVSSLGDIVVTKNYLAKKFVSYLNKEDLSYVS